MTRVVQLDDGRIDANNMAKRSGRRPDLPESLRASLVVSRHAQVGCKGAGVLTVLHRVVMTGHQQFSILVDDKGTKTEHAGEIATDHHTKGRPVRALNACDHSVP